MYMSTSVTLDEFLNRDGDHINQVVYKVDGNFNGNITGDNVTVILMGDGDINGSINARDGEVVLIRGDINGNVKADKVICPTEPEENAKKTLSHNPAKDVKSPELATKNIHKTCFDCAHLRFGVGVGLMVCDIIHKPIRNPSPCADYIERKYR